MPEFSMSIQAQAPIEDVWKLLHDPNSFPLWWAGMETIEPGGDGAFIMWPTGYPDFQWRSDSMLLAPITA